MQSTIELFENSLGWLRDNYAHYRFSVERYVVWTIRTYIQQQITRQELPYQVFNDYPVLPGLHRSLSADLVILGPDSVIELAAEFKYEPSHDRKDIQKQKLPVVFWGKEGVGEDIRRIHEFAEKGLVKAAYSIFIDEGGYFRNRVPHPQSAWMEWGGGTAVLQAKTGMAATD